MASFFPGHGVNGALQIIIIIIIIIINNNAARLIIAYSRSDSRWLDPDVVRPISVHAHRRMHADKRLAVSSQHETNRPTTTTDTNFERHSAES